jgi:hypothetical protein
MERFSGGEIWLWGAAGENQAERCSADGRGARPYTSGFLALLGMTKCLAGSRTESVLKLS